MKEAADVNEKKLSREINLIHASVMVLCGKPHDALVEFEHVITSTRESRQEDEVFAEALVNYGDVRKEMGKADHALTLYEEASSVVYDLIEAHGLDLSVLCQVPAQADYEPVRVLSVRAEDAEPIDKETPLEPGTVNTDTLAWEKLECLYIPHMQLFIDISLRRAQCFAEKGQLMTALNVLCLARQIMLRTCNPLPQSVAHLNLLFGRIHTQLVWERGCFTAESWGKFDRIIGGPDAIVEVPEGFDMTKSFEFATLCLRECVRIITESASNDRSMLRVALTDLVRLHGMGALQSIPDPEAAVDAEPIDSNGLILRNAALSAEYMHESVSCTVMLEVLFNDTVSLLDKPVIDGSDIPPAITAGLQDAERFFGEARINRPGDDASMQVGALSVLMYYLTLLREQPLSGMSHFRRLERWATRLHRQLKKMFPKYAETCCYSLLSLENEVSALPDGTIRIQWAEFPFVESEEESPLYGDGSRPSSGASRVVQKSRDDAILPKDLPTTMVYSFARPPPVEGEADPQPILGMLQSSVEQVEELLHKFQELKYLIEGHKKEQEGEPLPESVQEQIKSALSDVWSFFQSKGPGERIPHSDGIDLKLPEDADIVSWVPSLVKMFRRQLGVELVDLSLWQWLLAAVSQRETDLHVVGDSPEPPEPPSPLV